MKLYVLTKLENADAVTADTSVHLSLDAAQALMRAQYEACVKLVDQNGPDYEPDEEKCYHEMEETTAVIRDGLDVYTWDISEQDLPIKVAVTCKGGLVCDVYSTTVGVEAEVLDLDADEDGGIEKAVEEIENDPSWHKL